MRSTRVLPDWQFTRDDPDATDDAAWESVTLPHAWNTSPDGVPAAADDRGPGWYRRDIEMSGRGHGRRVYLRVAAGGTVTDVSCNGIEIGGHRGGYSAFVVELTDALDHHGRGDVVVRVDNSPTDDVYPLMGDHTIFGGLYRGVELMTVDPVHFVIPETGGPGVVARLVGIDERTATVEVTVEVANRTDRPVTPDIHVAVADADDIVVATAVTAVAVEPESVATARTEVLITDPRRWDGRDDPYCYTATASIDGIEPGDAGDSEDAVSVDEIAVAIGLREIRIDPDDGFFLNGRPYPLRGVSRHHDVNGTPAVTDEEIHRDFDLIDEMGANAVRLAHYQHGDAVLTECDRRGIVVWAEVPVNSLVSTADPLGNAALQLRELIAQQRHHPSIVCWGVQNETAIGDATNDPRPTIADLAALVAELDPDRPSAQAQVTIVSPEDPVNALCDLNAVNLYHGWYMDEAVNVGAALDAYRAAYPEVPLGLSEYGADATTTYHSADPTPGDYTEEYQAIFHEIYLRQIDERPWLWATFVWNMFDFASVIRNEGGTRGFNMKGLVTRERGTRKDAFFWYKVNWSRAPMVHICSKRFVRRTGDVLPVKVYSNEPSVSLTVNGLDAGPAQVDGRIFTWEAPLGLGTNRVVATAGDLEDTATFERVAEADPSYVCPTPRRVLGGDRMASWYEEQGIELDRSGWGFWSNVGELLDDPGTRAVLIDFFGTTMLEHPQMEIARGFDLEFVLGVAAPDLEPERFAELQTRLSAVPKGD